MTLTEAIAAVRRQIDDVYIGGGAIDADVGTDADLWQTYATRFSDEDISQRLESACIWVAGRVRASFIPGLLDDIVAGDLDDEIPFVRLVDESVERDGIVCERRNERAVAEMIAASRIPTAKSPIYTFEDARLQLYPSGYTAMAAKVIRVPGQTGSEHAIDDVPEELEGAVILRCAYLLSLSLPTHTEAVERGQRLVTAAEGMTMGMQVPGRMTPPILHASQIQGQ